MRHRPRSGLAGRRGGAGCGCVGRMPRTFGWWGGGQNTLANGCRIGLSVPRLHHCPDLVPVRGHDGGGVRMTPDPNRAPNKVQTSRVLVFPSSPERLLVYYAFPPVTDLVLNPILGLECGLFCTLGLDRRDAAGKTRAAAPTRPCGGPKAHGDGEMQPNDGGQSAAKVRPCAR